MGVIGQIKEYLQSKTILDLFGYINHKKSHL